MGIVQLAAALLGATKSIVDLVTYNKIMALLNEYEDNEKAYLAEQAKYPNWDSSKIDDFRLNRIRLDEALKLQASLIKPAALSS